MANRYPLIVDSSTQLIKELPAGDGLLFADNDKIVIGTGTDLTLYHDGSNSYITNAIGALKVATETSGIAVTIGHTTSETTVADNLTVTGDFSVGGNFDVTGTLDFSDSAISNVGDISLDSISGDSDSDTAITFSGSDVITVAAGGDNQVTFTNGAIVPSTDNDIDLGTSSVEFKDAFFDGTVEADAITIAGTALNEYIADTVGAMVGSNTETNITVTYEDGDNTLDFVIGTLNQDTSGTAALVTVTDSTANTDFPVVFHNESNGLLDDTAAFEYNPSTGTLIVANLDIGTDVDIDGTLEADAITIGGVTLAETIADTVGAMVGSNTETGITVTYEDSDNTLDFVLGTITSLGTIGTGVWQGTAIASTYIAADAITGAKIADDAIDSEHYADGSIDNAHIADDAIDSEHYADGSIDTAHIADNQVTHDKLENRYTVLSALGTGTDQTLDFSAATTFTATMNGNATFTITNPKQGQVVDLILAGDYTPTLAMSGATFNKVGSVDYDGSTTNLIQIVVADDSASEIFYYSVAAIASDTTP